MPGCEQLASVLVKDIKNSLATKMSGEEEAVSRGEREKKKDSANESKDSAKGAILPISS